MEVFSAVNVTAADVAEPHSSAAPRGTSGNSLLRTDALKYNAVGEEEDVFFTPWLKKKKKKPVQ